MDALLKHVSGKILTKAKLVNTGNQPDTSVHNLPFKIVQLAANAFVISAAVLTCYNFWGNPILCFAQSGFSDVRRDSLDTFCWINGVHTVAQRPDGQISPGVAQPLPVPPNEKPERYPHTYYIWVPIVLFLLSTLMRLPGALWATLEHQEVVKHMEKAGFINSDGKGTKASKESLLELNKHLFRYHGHRHYYGLWFLLCQVALLASVIAVTVLIDVFLNGNFFDYGTSFFSPKAFFVYEQVNGRTIEALVPLDPMAAVFPTMAKCFYMQIGEGGVPTTIDYLCMMPVNTVNQKLFVGLWLLLFVLSVYLLLNVIYQMALMLMPKLRMRVTLGNVPFYFPSNTVMSALNCVSFGEWVLIHRLGCNVGQEKYAQMLTAMSNHTGRPFDQVLQDVRALSPSKKNLSPMSLGLDDYDRNDNNNHISSRGDRNRKTSYYAHV